MASSNSTSSFTAVNHDDFSQLDLNGKIMIKAQYLDDIRKTSIIGDEITFDELILMMQRLFKLQPTDEIQLKYRDDDDDLISIIDDNDLSFAIQYSRILKLKVLVNQSNALSSSSSSGLMKMNTISNQSNNLKEVCSQLIEIRNRCNQLLEKLHFGGNENSSMVVSGSKSVAVGDTSEQQSQTIDNSSSNNVGDSSAISSSKSESNAYGQPPKELDPLNNKSPVNEQNDSSKNIDKRASIESDSKQHPVEQSISINLEKNFSSQLNPIGFYFSINSCPATSHTTSVSCSFSSSTSSCIRTESIFRPIKCQSISDARFCPTTKRIFK